MNRRDLLKRAAVAAGLIPFGGCVTPDPRRDFPMTGAEPSPNRPIVHPQDADFVRPGRRDYFVRLEHPSIWASYLIPVTVIVGPEAKDGRGLLATGSTHGDEYEGPVALKHLLREIKTDDVRGRIILIPVLDVPAFKAGRRETPDDGMNLNRAFPGDAKGGITSRIADFVNRLVFPHAHVVLDIHAGGEVARFPQLASFHAVADAKQEKEIEETARGFGTRFTMIYQNQTPGLLTSTAEAMGKITVGSELGWGRSLQVEGVAMAKRGVLAAAVRHGQLRGELPGAHFQGDAQLLVDASDPASSLLSPVEGHFEPAVPLGGAVKKGDRLAWLHDFNRIDDAPVEVMAPHDGYVICQAWGAKVLQGQVITQVGKPSSWAK
jgi:N2-acetyl-L-2,4-diaminobutanoate deacetylase